MATNPSPLISVIIPSYNHARFLPACIGSVVEQDYSELELIVLDDRSRDESMEVLTALCLRDEIRSAFRGRLTVQANPKNLGAHDTINRGIALSSGEYIAILNSDDGYGLGRLKAMMQAILETPARFAFSAVDFIDDSSAPIVRPSVPIHKMRLRQSSIHRFPTVGFACLVSNVAISTGNFLFERRLFDEIGGFKNLRYCHDWDFLLRALLVTEPLYVPDATYNYRVHGSNSFLSLEHVAASESATVYATYFDRIIANHAVNPLAPGPRSWPNAFEVIMEAYGLWQFWRGTRPGEQPTTRHA